MNDISHIVLVLFYGLTTVSAAPATAPPTQAINPDTFNISTFSIASPADTISLPLPNLTTDFYQWRIYASGLPSPISLRIAPNPLRSISKASLGITILTTQRALSTYIAGHYGAANDPLLTSDDPYKSSSQLTGCFVGVDSFPKGNRHLTYGVVALVLQGLWDFLYKGGRFVEAVFEVQHDEWGSVGIGRVSKDAPR